VEITANDPGMYSVIVYQDGYMLKDTCWVLDMIFDAKFDLRQPAKPAKVTVPQVFNVQYGAAQKLPGTMAYTWDFDGGTPVSADKDHARVIWNTTGRKQLKLHLSAIGPGCMGGTPFLDRECDTTLVYDVLVHEKNLGFFVDQNVPYENEHNGTGWSNAFPTLQQALALASQGDCIWVADGHYSPRDSFPATASDSAMVYTGYYMLDYDSLRIFTPSYVMDWDSVQVFGGFSGYDEGEETNLSERDVNAYPVVLHGSDGDSPVIKIDGSTQYTHLGAGFYGVLRAARWDGVTVCDGQAARGAGILFENGASGTVSNSIVKSNRATVAGGGIYVGSTAQGEPPLLYGVQVSGNTAEEGAGIYNDGSALLMVNVTVAGNLASSRGGGLYNASGDPVIRNSIIYSNRTGSGEYADVRVAGGTPRYTASDIGGSKPGGVWDASFGINSGGNADALPGFTSPGFDERGRMVEGDYRLRSLSGIATEGGANSMLRIPYPQSIVLSSPSPRNTVYGDRIGRDLAGENRIIYDYVDMGAYEFQGTVVVPEVVYRVEVPSVEGAATVPPPGVYYITAREDFVFRLIPREQYTLTYTKVKTGSRLQDEEGYTEMVENADGTRTYIFHEVLDRLKIEVTGVSPSGNVEATGASLWAESKQLHVQTPSDAVVSVYMLTGQLYTQQKVSAGTTSIALPSGMYIVTLDGSRRVRIVVR
jgi:hypothetical protein